MHSTIEIVTPPASEPVTLDEVKTHLRLLADTGEDDLLDMLITAARQAFEAMTDGRIVMPTTFRQHFAGWPWAYHRCPAELPLGVGNVTEVSSVTYFDEDEDEQELEGWSSDLTGTPALVYLPGDDWPALSVTKPRPVTVEFVAGYEDVPSAVKLGILTLVGNWYSYRESHGSVDLKQTPYGFDRLCGLYRTGLGGF